MQGRQAVVTTGAVDAGLLCRRPFRRAILRDRDRWLSRRPFLVLLYLCSNTRPGNSFRGSALVARLLGCLDLDGHSIALDHKVGLAPNGHVAYPKSIGSLRQTLGKPFGEIEFLPEFTIRAEFRSVLPVGTSVRWRWAGASPSATRSGNPGCKGDTRCRLNSRLCSLSFMVMDCPTTTTFSLLSSLRFILGSEAWPIWNPRIGQRDRSVFLLYTPMATRPVPLSS